MQPGTEVQQLKLVISAVFVIGVLCVLQWFLLVSIPVIGLFRPQLSSKTQDMSVELTGTPFPPPAIGLLRRLMLRVPTMLAIIMAVRTTSLRRPPAVSVPSGV